MDPKSHFLGLTVRMFTNYIVTVLKVPFDKSAPIPDIASPELDKLFIFNILRTSSVLRPLLDSDLREDQITSSQLNILEILYRSGDRTVCMSELGKQLVVSKANITGLIDRLEKRGWVVRQGGADRRETIVRITEAGRETVERVIPGYHGVLSDLCEGLAAAEKAAVVHTLSELRRLLRRRRAGEGK